MSSPTRCRSAPIAAQVAPEGNYVWSAWSRRLRVSGIDAVELRRRKPCAAGRTAVHSASARSTIMATSPGPFDAAEGRRLGTATRSARARKRIARQIAAAAASGNISKLPRRRPMTSGEIHFEEDGSVTVLTGTLDLTGPRGTTFAAGSRRTSRRSFSTASASCRATATGWRLAAAPAGPSRPWPRARRSGEAMTGDRDRQVRRPHLLEAAIADIEFARAFFRSPAPTGRSA